MEKTAVVGIKNEVKANAMTLDMLGFLNNVDSVFIYNDKLLKPPSKPITERFINAINPNLKVYYAEELFSCTDIKYGTEFLYQFLILPENNDILSKIIMNIPKRYRPSFEDIPSYSSLKYELQFIFICLIINKDLRLVDRYGEKLDKILKLLFSRFSLHKGTKLKLVKDKKVEAYHAVKPLPLPVTPLPYRIVNVENVESAIETMKRYNQLPLVDSINFNKLLIYGLEHDRDRFINYLEQNVCLKLKGLSDQEIINALQKKILIPLFKSS